MQAAITAWSRLMRASAVLLAAVEADLKAEGLPPLIWYDALLELNRRAPHGLRPVELQQEMLLRQYNVSRLLDRLEKANLVCRSPDPQDGRGQIITITPAGEDTLKRMWPVYRQSLETHVASRLSTAEAQQLAVLLAQVLPGRFPENA